MPISREVQQLKANVTEAADEAVVGIEMVQAFGREDDVQADSPTRPRPCATVCCGRRGWRRHSCRPLVLPTLSIGAVVYFGGREVIGATLTYGEFFLFYQLLLQLVWPLEALGWICRSRSAPRPRRRAASRGCRASRPCPSRLIRPSCRRAAWA